MSKNILDETTMGGIPMKNRLVRSATWENLVDRNGLFDENFIQLYEKLAEGGVGLIITGFTTVSDMDDDFGGMMRLDNDELIPQFQKLVQAVKKFDCPIIPQLALGSYRKKDANGVHRKIEITEMEHQDIAQVVDLFSQAAVRAQKAGFDGVQIHAAHGFFLSRCLSPLYNKRHDQYGGFPENRARILTEIIDAVREKTGNFHISMKINCEDFQIGGLSAFDSRVICNQIVLHGINSIEVSGNGASRSGIKAHINEGYFQTYAAELQKNISVPVISVGGYRSVEYINKVLNETPLEYISLSRPLIREPELPKRWKNGNLTPSACISCNACYTTQGHGCIFKSRVKGEI